MRKILYLDDDFPCIEGVVFSDKPHILFVNIACLKAGIIVLLFSS